MASATSHNPEPQSPQTPQATPPTHLRLDASALSDALDAIAGFVSEFEPGRYSGEDAARLVTWFTRAERLCAAGKTLAATRAAAANCHQTTGQRSAAHWLAGVTGESVGNAVELLRLGETLGSHPGVDEAYRTGRLSPSGAKAVAGAVAVNPNSEGELLQVAEGDTLSRLRDRCLRARAEGRSKTDAARVYEGIRAARHCRTWTDADGAFRLDARLTPDAGAALLSSLSAESDRAFRRARAAGIRESRDACAADALVALVAGRGIGVPDQTTSAGRSKEGGCGTGDGTDDDAGPDCHVPEPKATVHLRVDLDALRRGGVGDGERCEIPGVGPVPIEVARDLMGDAITDLVIANGVDVTTICHLGRSIPAPLKTALIERDAICVVPGCDVATGLEIDHWMVPFAAGGPASLENLARLCSHHHHLRTHKGFRLDGGPGDWRWRPPAAQKGPGGPSPGLAVSADRDSRSEAPELFGGE
ncbi:MAG: HNH endonuclease signature motif containing protein [Acidimicrobiales bacterium]